MQHKDDEAKKRWDDCVKINGDPYGAATVAYAKAWAEMMEAQIADGASLADIAKKTSHDADTEGITGFMYGCAVSQLADMWIHGEELRRWHNLDTQCGNEGEKANEEGGVLNPALVKIELP